MPILRGTKVMLRPYREEDKSCLLSWTNDVETTQYVNPVFLRPYTQKNADDFVDRMMQGSDDAMSFIIADAVTEAYLGQIDLRCISWMNRSAELGIVLASEDQRNQGRGQEAIQLLLRHAFVTMGLNRVCLCAYGDNSRAIHCYEKAGFMIEGTARQAQWCHGKFMDLINMGILAEDWKEQHHV